MRLTFALLAPLLGAYSVSAQNATGWPWQTYRSSPLEPPSLKVTKSGPPTSPGYLFFDQNGPEGHTYSLFIMTDENELVWQNPAIGDYSAFKAQVFQGRPVLTFFNGVSFSEPYGWGYGIIQILDESYESIYNVSLPAVEGGYESFSGVDTSQLGSWIDIHEARITPDNTMLVTLYNVTRMDLSSIGGPVDGWVTDSLFYEIDITSNEVLFQWSALDHVEEIPLSHVVQFYPLGDYGRNQSLPYGYFHINSVDKFLDGSYLISSRFFSSIFKIAKNGTVVWTFQGNDGGDFELGPGIAFRYQHDARIHKETDSGFQLSLFNNDNSDVTYGVNETTGIFLDMDTKNRKATLNQELLDPQDTIYAASQGNVQLLPNDHVIMGYGSTPKIKEYDPTGSCLMTAQFGPGDGTVFSYRAYRLPWVGRPTTPPSVFACMGQSNQTLVYMSWNGATEHEEWVAFAGSTHQTLGLVGKAKKTGFETVMSFPGHSRYVYVEAHGRGISAGRSEVVSSDSHC